MTYVCCPCPSPPPPHTLVLPQVPLKAYNHGAVAAAATALRIGQRQIADAGYDNAGYESDGTTEVNGPAAVTLELHRQHQQQLQQLQMQQQQAPYGSVPLLAVVPCLVAPGHQVQGGSWPEAGDAGIATSVGVEAGCGPEPKRAAWTREGLSTSGSESSSLSAVGASTILSRRGLICLP